MQADRAFSEFGRESVGHTIQRALVSLAAPELPALRRHLPSLDERVLRDYR